MIIGLTGPICAGKDEVAKLLSARGFERFSLSDEIRAEMCKEGIELTRKNIQDYGDSVRKREGNGAWAKRVLSKLQSDKHYVIDSIRNPAEVEEFRRLAGFHLLKVHAAPKVRFSRMVKRAREQDPKTFEEFNRVETRDLGIGQPDYGQQQAHCFALADKTVVNEGTIERLEEEVTQVLAELAKHSNP